jgi:amino acid transporter
LGNLNGGLLAGSRIPFAMAEQKDLPKIFGVTHPSFKTPWISLLLTGIFTVGMTLYSNFVTALTIATITRLLVYMVTCASLIRFRMKGSAPAAAFRVPFGEIVAVASLIAIGWLLWQVDYGKEGLAMVAAVLLGLAVFFINRVFRAIA